MRSRRILSAYGSSLLGLFSGILTNFWFLKVLTSQLSKNEFGLYAYVLQITAYFGFLLLGIDFAASRDIAKNLALGRQDEAFSAYQVLGRFNRIAGAVCAAGTVILALVIPRLGLRGWDQPSVLVGLTLLVGFSQVLGFFQVTPSAALIGSQQQWIVNLLTTLRSVATTLLAYALLEGGAGIYCIAIAGVVTAALHLLCSDILCRKYCPWTVDPSRKTLSREKFKELFQFGGLNHLGYMAWTVESTSDVFLLGAYGGPEAVAIYVLWWRFPSMLISFCTRLSDAAFPTWVESSTDPGNSSARLLEKVGMLSLGLGTLALLGTGLWLPNFVRLWLGHDYLALHPRFLALEMGALVLVRVFGNLFSMFWLSQGKVRLTTGLSIVLMVTKLGLGIVLTRLYGVDGLLGASIINGVAQCAGLGIPLYLKKHFNVKTLISGLALTAGALLLAIWIGGAFIHDVGPFGFGLGVAATALFWGLVWTGAAWKSALNSNLRQLKVFRSWPA
ncbi:MAG TPA: oligosaccharide flippase family protein [bacterium]|jgi:O-antigen/teichoic acid export membrane protein|nr:oligosaccharide flippase family protein [bacterium]